MDLIQTKPKGAISTLILAHGAGAPKNSSWMGEVTSYFFNHQVKVIRFNFPYMDRRELEGRKFPPDRLPKLQEHFLKVIDQAHKKKLIKGKLYIGGKSMGARVSTTIEHELIHGAICFGFPFYAPGKPGLERTNKLKECSFPVLILQGERDPFGGKEWISQARLTKNIEFKILPDGNHDLKPRVKSGFTQKENLETAVVEASRFIKKLN